MNRGFFLPLIRSTFQMGSALRIRYTHSGLMYLKEDDCKITPGSSHNDNRGTVCDRASLSSTFVYLEYLLSCSRRGDRKRRRHYLCDRSKAPTYRSEEACHEYRPSGRERSNK